ncbi:hypothetical protein ACFZAR_05395 [Streptomyces sp. NPDC008222]|uniref:hypothetical protein n=1 Tax=Streptomyces sp. NPDC008222 TaxID=3364820 RepID=UPI0036E34BB9
MDRLNHLNLGLLYLAFVAVTAVGCLAIWCATGASIHAAERRCTRIPAAPDNQPGTNPDDLWTCRRINALPTTSRKETRP